MAIVYALENDLCAADFLAVLDGSGLAERRPVGDLERIAKMLKHADLIVTARDEAGGIVGVARSVTDFSFCCYLSDLAVDKAFQGQGIGARLIKRTRAEAGRETTLVLLSAPQAMTYYPKVGLDVFDNCFGLKRPWTED
ncbi:GNAT family N-acetyltransferase [Varunaivibrio sulfuroxidans]|uniref:Acetyltransferase (GNAT) family protein n=1 Tax=Varunaivibrio sulfuroxidans TaxID=1773489 RepID=A0A4R3JBX7_9PROT|nr:GNAT family N-acetyltransferase [Varunaivibrio sulfuroxidans]TCS63164.1 acetyltransferase (GNAT) family protein [Varunaivibrio sulfuroxidans]WES31774.1 GNAT family N-acetyltransferase [Varunaivibrio sulfuroxidans]